MLADHLPAQALPFGSIRLGHRGAGGGGQGPAGGAALGGGTEGEQARRQFAGLGGGTALQQAGGQGAGAGDAGRGNALAVPFQGQLKRAVVSLVLAHAGLPPAKKPLP